MERERSQTRTNLHTCVRTNLIANHLSHVDRITRTESADYLIYLVKMRASRMTRQHEQQIRRGGREIDFQTSASSTVSHSDAHHRNVSYASRVAKSVSKANQPWRKVAERPTQKQTNDLCMGFTRECVRITIELTCEPGMHF